MPGRSASSARSPADGRSATVAGVELHEGETVSVDGDRGLVSRGARSRVPAESDPVLARFLAWRQAAAA